LLYKAKSPTIVTIEICHNVGSDSDSVFHEGDHTWPLSPATATA
jgi:hypothetical protein